MDRKKKLVFKKDNIGIGRRKQASARVFLKSGNGQLSINRIPGNEYLQYNNNYLNLIWLPLKKLELHKEFSVTEVIMYYSNIMLLMTRDFQIISFANRY